MTEREKKAKELFESGYNCTQAVVGAFADLIPIDRELLLKMSSPFGGGMGRLREVCGTFSGMLFVLGALGGYSDNKALDEKKELYSRVQRMAAEFREMHGTIVCRELLKGKVKAADSTDPQPEARTEEYYRKRPCSQLAADAAGIVERELNNSL